MAAIEDATLDPQGAMRLAGVAQRFFGHAPVSMTPQGALGIPTVQRFVNSCCPR